MPNGVRWGRVGLRTPKGSLVIHFSARAGRICGQIGAAQTRRQECQDCGHRPVEEAEDRNRILLQGMSQYPFACCCIASTKASVWLASALLFQRNSSHAVQAWLRGSSRRLGLCLLRCSFSPLPARRQPRICLGRAWRCMERWTQKTPDRAKLLGSRGAMQGPEARQEWA